MPLPEVKIPKMALRLEKMVQNGVPEKEKTPKTVATLKRAAGGLRHQAKEIRSVATHEASLKRAKAKHFSTAAKHLGKEATKIAKEIKSKEPKKKRGRKPKAGADVIEHI
jgi:hypothetical protein